MTNKNRGWQRVLLLIIPYIFVVGLFQFIGMTVAGVNINEDLTNQSSEQHLITVFFDLTGTFLLLFLFMKFVDKEKFINLGFHTSGKLKEFIIGIVLGGLIMASAYFLLEAIQEINFTEIIVSYKDIIITILLFTIVAIVEETLLRGYILRNLMLSFNKYAALVISSLLFSLMHSFNPNIDLFSLVGLFLAGLLLGISYIHTKNLWFPIALHISWNLFQTLFGFNVSGQDFYSLIEFKISENSLLNGGAFGFEGSILSIITEVILLFAIGIYYIKKRKTLN